MLDYERKDFAKLLKRGALEGRRWMRSTDSEAVRIYDRNLEGVPVTVDLYGKYAKIVDYAPGALDESTKAQVIDLVNRMAYVELGRIIYQVRRKREGLEQHTLMSDEKVELVVKEHGLEFLVDLTSHIDTGLFLDHAITREYVRSISEGLRVLNLFSYTGSFSVYAAAGKAESVTSVDMSNTYCAIAERNLAANGFIDKSRFPVVVSDALVFIDKAVAEGAQYDLVVFDPPSFSNSHRMARPFDVKKDYLAWMSKLSRIMSDHAILIFSCNSSTFALDKSTLKRSFRITGITEQMAPVGFSRSKGGMSRTWLMEKLDLFEWREDHSREYGTGRSKVKTVDDQDFEHLVSSIDSEEAQAGGDRPSRRDDRRGRSEGRPSYRDDRRPSWRGRDERRDEGGSSYRGDRRGWSGDRDVRRGRDEDRRPYDRGDRRSSYRSDDRRGRDEGRPSYRDDRRPSWRGRDERRDEGGSSYRGDRREWSGDRDVRRGRDEGRRPYGAGEGRSSWSRDDGRPSYRDRSSGDDRRPYQDRDGRSRAQSHSYDKARRARKSIRPYGYDSIRSSRNREDGDQE